MKYKNVSFTWFNESVLYADMHIINNVECIFYWRNEDRKILILQFKEKDENQRVNGLKNDMIDEK